MQLEESDPCGCCRERTAGINPTNFWSINRKGNNYSHKECGQEI